jgi:hypothetical protein
MRGGGAFGSVRVEVCVRAPNQPKSTPFSVLGTYSPPLARTIPEGYPRLSRQQASAKDAAVSFALTCGHPGSRIGTGQSGVRYLRRQTTHMEF